MADFNDLIVEQIPHLRRYAMALIGDRDRADDLVHDCLARALGRWRLWRPGSNVRSWLFAILHNLHLNALRRRRRSVDNVPLDTVGEGRQASPPEQGKGLAMRDLDRALAELPDEQRAVVLLIGLEDLSYREAAEVLGVPIGTVMSRLSRGREALRRLMDGSQPALRRVK